MTSRTYPMPRPQNDPRFTLGLLLDVASVLERHGFPSVSGADLGDLGQALFRYLYAAADGSSPSLAEYRSALAYWECKASEAKAAGQQGEYDSRMEGVVALRKTIRRIEAEGGAS